MQKNILICLILLGGFSLNLLQAADVKKEEEKIIYYTMKVDTSSLNPLQIQSAVAFFRQHPSIRLDARVTIQFSTNKDSFDIYTDKSKLAKFAQGHRKNKNKPGEGPELPMDGTSLILEISALPILLSTEYSANQLVEFLTEIAEDAVHEAASKQVNKQLQKYPVVAPVIRHATNGLFKVLRPELVTLKKSIADVVGDIIDGPIHHNYRSAIVRNTFRKAYFGGFKVFDTTEKEVSVVYFKLGRDENFMKTPLVDRMPVQAVHNLAGSGPGMTASIGMVATLGDGKSIDTEFKVFQYQQSFSQPLVESASQIVRFQETNPGDLSFDLTISYFDQPNNFDLVLRGASLEGKTAGEIRLRKGFGAKTNLYVDYAYNEKNEDTGAPSFIRNQRIRDVYTRMRADSEAKVLLNTVDRIVFNPPLQDAGSSARQSFLIALDHIFYSGDLGDFHYTVYASKEQDFQNTIQYATDNIKEKTTIGMAVSWVKEYEWTSFKAYASLEYSELEFETMSKDYDRNGFSFAMAGSYAWGGTNTAEIKKRQQAKTAAQAETYLKIIKGIAKSFQVYAAKNGQWDAIEACGDGWIQEIYRHSDKYPLRSMKRSFRNHGEMKARPDLMWEAFEKYFRDRCDESLKIASHQ